MKRVIEQVAHHEREIAGGPEDGDSICRVEGQDQPGTSASFLIRVDLLVSGGGSRKAVMKGPARDFDDYLVSVPEPARTTLEKMRKTIRAAVPEATEAISYRLPTFKYQGKPLVAPGAAKDHCSFFLMGYIPPELEGELEKYDIGKGTIRFPVDQPLPASLVRKVVKARIAQVEAGKGYGRRRS